MTKWYERVYYFDKIPLRLSEHRELLCFGMPLFGYWLPFVGFVEIDGESYLFFQWFLKGMGMGW